MKRIVFAVSGFLFIALAHSASFDCTKASTKVERIICDNSEISKLDEELAASYKASLQNQSKAVQIKQTQRRWMSERNGCVDTECVRDAYRKRIGQLLPAQNVAAQTSAVSQQAEQSAAAKTDTGAVKKYPPYPDVWEMRFPILENKQLPAVRNAWLDNGDIWLGFVPRGTKKYILVDGIPIHKFKGFTFFSQQGVAFDKSGEEGKLDDGSIVSLVKPAPGVNYFPNKAVIKDGSYVSAVSGDFYGGCYQGPAGNTLTRYKSKTTRDQLQPSKAVFLLLDEPLTFPTGVEWGSNRSPKCDASEQQVTTRVVSLDGEILPLEDGGFLLLNVSYGWVIRFDANLNTHTKLLNKKLFVLDSGILGATRFIKKITGKSYRDEDGWTEMQEVVDDLYAYLIELSKGKEAGRE